VDDALLVHKLEASDELGRHEAKHLLGRRLCAEALLEGIEVASDDEVEHHESHLGRLEAVVEVDEEGVVERSHHVGLDAQVDHPPTRHLSLRLLRHELHRVPLVRVLLAHRVHLAKRARVELLDVIEVVGARHLLLAHL